MQGDEVFVVVLSLASMVGGVVVILAGLLYRSRMRELRHKERLAMIDKGLMPQPDLDPHVVIHHGLKQRSLSFGIIVVGLGFALMFVIGIAGSALDTGVGIGGAVVILGTAFIVRSIYAAPPAPPPPPQPPVAATPGSGSPDL